jgi:ABC-type amino acid transport system permease subunit
VATTSTQKGVWLFARKRLCTDLGVSLVHLIFGFIILIVFKFVRDVLIKLLLPVSGLLNQISGTVFVASLFFVVCVLTALVQDSQLGLFRLIQD